MEFNFATPYDLQMQIVREKHKQLEEIMKEEEISCWLIFVRETAANKDPIYDLVVGGDVVWETAFLFYFENNEFKKISIIGNFDADAEEGKNIWDQVYSYTEGISKVFIREIRKINPKTIHINYSLDDVVSDGLSHGMFLKLENMLKDENIQFKSATPIIQKLRARKTETELNIIKKACEITEEINDTMTNELKPNMTEIEIQNMFHNEMDKLGVLEAWQRDACPAVDAGPNKVLGHVGPTEGVTKQGHTLHNDFGVKYHGYCSDIQRMWFFGKKDEIPDELNHAFETVHGAITKAAQFIKPGVTGYEVDKVARNHVIERGYEEYKHALGHQVGTKAHDGGVILGPMWERYGDTPKGIVEKNNVFTLELYVKTENYGMVSLEEDIVVTENGCEFIVPRQMDWICIDS